MKIHVCVKHVPDSAATIRILDKTAIDEQITFLLNPYDENAIAEAVLLKERIPEAEIVAITVGKREAAETLCSVMAMGADRSIHIVCDAPVDAIVTAKALGRAMRQDGVPDIVFAGKESIDSEGMQTMFRLAAELEMPAATGVVHFETKGGAVRVFCELESGAKEELEMELPCVVAAGRGLNRPKYPTLPQIFRSKRKEIKTVELDTLVPERPTSGMEIVELREATVERKGKRLSGTPEEITDSLVDILRREAKVI